MEDFNRLAISVKTGSYPREHGEIFFIYINSHYDPSLNKDNFFDEDSLRNIFLMSCWLAIFKVDLKKESALRNIIKKGNYGVIDAIREELKQRLLLKCNDCQHVMGYYYKNIVNNICRRCGSENIRPIKKASLYDNEYLDSFQGRTESKIKQKLLETMEFIQIFYIEGYINEGERTIVIISIQEVIELYPYARGQKYTHRKATILKDKIIRLLFPYKPDILEDIDRDI